MIDVPQAITTQRDSLDTADGHRIVVDTWQPQREVRGVIQVLHGMSEHVSRYGRFAGHCAGRGFAVVAHNHRGHGETCAVHDLGHFADDDGWGTVIGDVARVHDHLRQRFAAKPVVLFAHSMGSYIGQSFVMREQPDIAAMVLSGSNAAPRGQLYLGRFVALIETWLKDRRYPSPRLNEMAFGAFNKRFAPARTDFDWLSRDASEVDRYVHDRLCGIVPTAGLWVDLLGGLLEIGSKKNLRKVPAGLPLLITGGSDDPVGGRQGMQRLHDAYVASGHTNVELKLYDGARHEMLNETNREEFTEYVLGWMLNAIGARG